jgi:hypothetical protein
MKMKRARVLGFNGDGLDQGGPGKAGGSRLRQGPRLFWAILLFAFTASQLEAQGQTGGAAKAPPAPTGFTAVAGGTGIQLNWDKPSAGGTRFNLYLSDETGKLSRKLTAQPTSDTQVILEKMKPTKVYYFVLTAVNPAGVESPPTDPLEVQAGEAQTPSPSDSSAVSDEDDTSSAADKKGDGDEPFTPNWTGQVGFTYSTEPDPSGQGEITQELTLTGTYNLTKGGHYFSVAAGGGQQILEGLPSSFGTFSLEGGLGLGVFLPTLEIAFQQGALASNSVDTTLTLNFQLFKPFELGAMFEGNPESHQAPLSQVVGGTSDKIDEIDSVDWTAGIVATVSPFDFLDFTLTGEEDYARTYQWQNILHSAQHSLDETERIPSGILGANLTFLTDFTLALTLQEGVEYIPEGVSYNPIRKKTTDYSTATEQSFSGYSVGLTYNL